MDRLTLELLAAHKPRYPTVFRYTHIVGRAELECAWCALDYLTSVADPSRESILESTREAPERAGEPCRYCQRPTEL